MGAILPNSRTSEVLAELGERLRRIRLERNERMEDVAERAGVGLRTLGRLEKGEGGSLTSFLKVLRALGRLQAVDSFLPTPTVSPLALDRMGGRRRRRASSVADDG